MLLLESSSAFPTTLRHPLFVTVAVGGTIPLCTKGEAQGKETLWRPLSPSLSRERAKLFPFLDRSTEKVLSFPSRMSGWSFSALPALFYVVVLFTRREREHNTVQCGSPLSPTSLCRRGDVVETN